MYGMPAKTHTQGFFNNQHMLNVNFLPSPNRKLMESMRSAHGIKNVVKNTKDVLEFDTIHIKKSSKVKYKNKVKPT